jgi:hypothetical protein
MARKTRLVKKENPAAVSDLVSAPIITPPKALVFISHDTRDANLAEAFADLIADVSAGTVKSFRSSDNKGTSGIGLMMMLSMLREDYPWLYEIGREFQQVIRCGTKSEIKRRLGQNA